MISLIQIDDFAPDALEVRNKVIAGDFKTVTGPDGADYTGVSLTEVPQWHEQLASILGRKITIKLSGFRLNLRGELPHSWLHSDDICASHATVLYLNLPSQCYGGTAFWKHRGIGIDRMPPFDSLRRDGIDPDWFCRMISHEWKDLTYWEQAGFVAMRFNRLITYPTAMFHSRYPFEGFGSGPEDGRLVWVCFYDC